MVVSRLEIKRQAFHLLCGVAFVVLIYKNILNALGIAIILVIGFILSYLSRERRIPGVDWLLEQFEREENFRKFPGRGAFFYGLGILIVLLLFEKDIVLAAIMILALGDSVSRLIGPYGMVTNPLNNKKFIEGCVAGIIAGFLGAMLFVNVIEAFLAAFIAMIAEGIEVRFGWQQLDDNLVIPIVAGAVIWLVRLL